MIHKLILLNLVLIVSSCQQNNDTPEQKTSETNTSEENKTIQHDTNLVLKPANWIIDRADRAKQKLSKSEGGKILWQSMEAHGGLENWFQQGAISFRFDYLPIGGGQSRISTQQVDPWSNKAIHQSVEDPEDTFGWDGEKAWMLRNDTAKFPYDVKFWALTPYYFIAQPFVFDGDGVIAEKVDDRELFGEAYDVVHITFEPGVGLSPDDYYYIYFDKETHLLKAIRYIVSYSGYFKKGEHSPEKIMVLNDYETHNGITIFKHSTTYATDAENAIANEVTEVKVSQFKALPEFENEKFDIPEGAVIID